MSQSMRTRAHWCAQDRAPWPEVVGELLEQGLSVRELAEAVGVSVSAVRGWQTGRRQPVGWAAVALADLWRYEAGRRALRRSCKGVTVT